MFQKLVAVKITKLNAISKTFKVKILPIKATLVYLVHPLWLGPPQFDFSFGIVAPEFRTTFPLNSNSSNIPCTKIHCIYDSLLFFLYILSTRIHCNCSTLLLLRHSRKQTDTRNVLKALKATIIYVVCMIAGTMCDSMEKSKKCYHHFAPIISDKKPTLISFTRNPLPSAATARSPAGPPRLAKVL